VRPAGAAVGTGAGAGSAAGGSGADGGDPAGGNPAGGDEPHPVSAATRTAVAIHRTRTVVIVQRSRRRGFATCAHTVSSQLAPGALTVSTMTVASDKVATFRALHVPGRPLLMPNPWDAGTAKLLASLGFAALATTSSGYAATLGRLDGAISRDEALAHAASIVTAVDIPVSADLENGFADDPGTVAATVTEASVVGLAGCSIEDFSGESIYDLSLAAERVAAAVNASRSRLVLTARAENHIRGNPDLADTIKRLQAYQEAGADVLYAPGLNTASDIRSVIASVDRPVNVLTVRGLPPVAELAELGVARISVGGAFSQVALAALIRAGQELQQAGTYGFLDLAIEGRQQAAATFTAL